MSAKEMLMAEPNAFPSFFGAFSCPVLLTMPHSHVILKIRSVCDNCKNDNSWCQKKLAEDFSQRQVHKLHGGSAAPRNFLREWPRDYKVAALMSTFARSTNHGRTFVATCVFAAFVWTLALTISPQLHQRIHADGNRSDHICAVTLVANGSYDNAAQPPLIRAPDLPGQFGTVLTLSSIWVQPVLLMAHIFANAPPARA